MNFFEHQESARKRTKLLVFLFCLAVFGIAVAIYFVILLVFGMNQAQQAWSAGRQTFSWWQPELFFWVLAGTVGFIGIVSLVRISTLKQGGGVVARMLGGRPVLRNTRDLGEKRLLNIIDEMAIASGIPVPEVYVLDKEEGINAFAAGFSTDDAAVAVTRGALEALNRDELQGVIAHEFSHVLNGDMRLNIQLIGILYGILAIASTGRIILRSLRGRTSSRRGNGAAVIVLLGLALLLIGYIGVLIGRLIQSAVSRQREFLADASAVQFTRNPHGIGLALLKIARHATGSALASPRASEVAHLLFGEGTPASFLSNLFATHPPLEERIRRIDPALLANPEAWLSRAAPPVAPPSGERRAPGWMAVPAAAFRLEPGEVMERIGTLEPSTLDFGAELMASLPPAILRALEDPAPAARLVYALLLDPDDAVREEQTRTLRQLVGDGEAEEALRLFKEVSSLRRSARLPLVELAAAALSAWPREKLETLAKAVEALIAADRRVTLFELGLKWLLSRRLSGERGPKRVEYRSIHAVAEDAAQLLAAVARSGSKVPTAAEKAFRTSLEQLSVPRKREWLTQFEAGRLGRLDQLEAALDRLSQASLGVRRQVIEAAAHCALLDRVVTDDEAEVLRLISLALSCPLPPFVAGKAA